MTKLSNFLCSTSKKKKHQWFVKLTAHQVTACPHPSSHSAGSGFPCAGGKTHCCSQHRKLLKNCWHKAGEEGVSLGVHTLPPQHCCLLHGCPSAAEPALRRPWGLRELKCLCKYSGLFHKSCVCISDIHREF